MDRRDSDSTNPETGWQYRPEGAVTNESLTPGLDPQLQSVVTHDDYDSSRSVTWSASEFIAHEKSMSWYLILAAITVVISVLVYIANKDITTIFIFVTVAIILGVAAGRKPRQMTYTIDDNGLTIGAKTLPFENFRSFAIDDEGPFANIIFLPLKRFMPVITAYVDPKDENAIIDVISTYLPIDHHRADAVERLMRRIRF